jgi:hypothetical protein
MDPIILPVRLYGALEVFERVKLKLLEIWAPSAVRAV